MSEGVAVAAAGASSSSRRASASSSASRHESADSRTRRRREKERKVHEHRERILKQQRQEQARAELTRLHKHKDFIAPLEFDNTLPPVPVDAKLLAFPFDDDFVHAYDPIQGVSSEASTLYRLHAPLDLDLTINLINPAAYQSLPVAERPPLHPADEFICSEEFSRPASRAKETTSGKEQFTWLKRSGLMHLDLLDSVYKHADPRAVATQAMEAKQKEVAAYFEGPRKARIEAGFAAVAGDAALVHPTNKLLQPKRVWDVQPCEELWGATMVQVAFDTEPYDDTGAAARGGEQAAAVKRARLEHAVLRTSSDKRVNVAEATSIVHHLLPATDSVDELQQFDESGARVAAGDTTSAPVNSFMLAARDYHMVVDTAAHGAKNEEMYALMWDDAGAVVRLVPIRARATLTAVRTHSHSGARAEDKALYATVTHRATTADEDDVIAIAHAELNDVDAAATRTAVAARRRARAAARAAEAEAASAASVHAGMKRSRDDANEGDESAAVATAVPSGIDDDFAVEE